MNLVAENLSEGLWRDEAGALSVEDEELRPREGEGQGVRTTEKRALGAKHVE
jgi:hypothetical protein